MAGVARAAAPIRFQVEPQAYSEALLDIAQQANVTLIGAAACSGSSTRRLAGSMTLEQALGQLLADAPCVARIIAPGAVEVVRSQQAEPPRPAPPTVVSELLVTATRRVRNARQLAVAVSAIPRSQLLNTGVSDAGEAAGLLAGVLATNLGPGRNKLLLRSLSDSAYTGRARSIVATYLDDLPVNYNAPDPDLRLVDVERVEVARGPQGALFGAGSISGVYRIVSRKPAFDRISAELRVTGALTKVGAASHATEGYVNLPVSGDWFGLRLSGYNEVQGGYLDDLGQQRKNVDRTERRGARLVALVQPGEAWTVTLTAAGQHLRSDDTHYTTPGLGLERRVRIPEPHVNDIGLLSASVRHSWSWGELNSSTGYVRHAYGSLYDATAQQHLYTSFAETSAYSERSRTEMFVQDFVMTSRGARRLEWLIGAFGSDTTVNAPSEFLAQVRNSPNVPVYLDRRRDHIREFAAYAEATYELSPGWTLAVGARAFSINTRTTSHVESERQPPRDIDRESTFTGVSPKASLQWNFAAGKLLYAVVSEGYRAGGVNSGGSLALPTQRETFAPDRLVNYEVGLKIEALSRRLLINTALSYDFWRDLQTDQFRPSGIPYTTNAGDARILGVETEVTFRAPYGFSAQLSGNLSRTRTLNANPDFLARLVDGLDVPGGITRLANSLPGAPSISGGALLSYERQVFGDWTMRLVGQATYVGSSRISFDQITPKTTGYTRGKLSAELSGDGFGVQVYVVNPLNDYGDTFAFGNPFNPQRTRQITPLRPVTVGLTLSAAM